MTIAENIKRIRKQKGLTQKQLGNLCIPKIGESTIRKYELGILNPKFDTVIRIAAALRVDFFDLVDLDEIENKLSPADKSIVKMSLANIDFSANKEKRIVNEFNKLNEEGKDKAIEHVEMLAKIPEYRKKEETTSMSLIEEEKKENIDKRTED